MSFKCDFPGCNREFKEERMMKLHRTRKHKKPQQDTLVPPPQNPPANPSMITISKDELYGMIKEVVVNAMKLEINTDPSLSSGQVTTTETEFNITDDVFARVSIKFIPRTLEYFRYTMAKYGKKLDISEWVNQVVDDHYTDCLGCENVIINRTVRRNS